MTTSLQHAATLLIPGGATVFSSHSHLQLDVSRLQEILQALIASNNAHEMQIQELQRQLLHPSQPQTPLQVLTSRSSDGGSTKSIVGDLIPKETQLAAAQDGQERPEAPRSAALTTRPSHPKKAVISSNDASSGLTSLQQHVRSIRCVLGLDTSLGQGIADKLMVHASGSSETISPMPAQLYEIVADLPFAAAIARRVARTQPPSSTDDKESGTLSLAALSAVVRGMEAQMDSVLATVEHLKQQVAVGANASKVAMSSSKAAVAHRAPTPATIASGPRSPSTESASVDSVARVDIARLTQDVLLLQSRVDALGNAVQSAAPPRLTAKDDPDAVNSRDSWSVPFANIVKRIEALEKASRTAEPASTKSGASGAAQAPGNSEDKCRQVEERLQEALRLAKESLSSSMHSHMETVAAALERLRDWTQSKLNLLEARPSPQPTYQGLDTEASKVAKDQTPVHNVLTFSNTGLSPYVPKRSAMVRAASTNPRGTMGLPGATHTPNHGDNITSTAPPLVFKLSTVATHTTASARRASIAAGEFNGVRPSDELDRPREAPAADRPGGTNRPHSATHIAPHDPATCVVWRCTWCATAAGNRGGASVH